MKKIHKTSTAIIGLLLTVTILTACGKEDGNGELIAGPGESIYSTNEFSIIYPQDWEILEQETFPSLVPHQTVTAFRNNIRNEIFTANVNISKTEIERGIDVEDFAKSTMARVRAALLDVQELPMEEYGEGVLIEFQARKSPVEPLIRFKSLSTVSNQTAYTITGAYLPTEEDGVVIKVDRMLESFRLN